MYDIIFFFFSSRRRHTRWPRDWSSDVCSSDLPIELRCELKDDQIRFSFRAPEGAWTAVPGSHPAWKLSDDFGPRLRFTGMFLGLRAEDLDSRGGGARFEDVHVSMRR